MTGLLLIDGDNVEIGTHLAAGLSRVAKLASGTTATACLALNTETLFDGNYRASDLRSAANALVQTLGATCAAIEIAVALTMPQTADFALQRLAVEAPGAGSALAYDYVIVFTRDRGLRKSIEGLVRKAQWARVDSSDVADAWSSCRRARALRRSVPNALSHASPIAPTTAGAFSVAIDDDPKASWVSARAVDIRTDQDLRDIAISMDSAPWLLTQIGPTVTTLRGVSRLNSVPMTAPVQLGGVAGNDGLEIAGDTPCPRTASTPRPASVGIGAVRFQNPAATVRCKLPICMLRDGIAYDVNRDGIDIRSALHHLVAGDPVGNGVTVVFTQERDCVVARVKPGPISVEAWWVKQAKAVSEARVLMRAVSDRFEAKAYPTPTLNDRSHRVSLCAGPKHGELVTARTNIARGQLGPALWEEHPGKTVPVGVYALRTNIHAGEKLPVQRIQSLNPSQLAGVENLRLLPLVVPL